MTSFRGESGLSETLPGRCNTPQNGGHDAALRIPIAWLDLIVWVSPVLRSFAMDLGQKVLSTWGASIDPALTWEDSNHLHLVPFEDQSSKLSPSHKWCSFCYLYAGQTLWQLSRQTATNPLSCIATGRGMGGAQPSHKPSHRHSCHLSARHGDKDPSPPAKHRDKLVSAPLWRQSCRERCGHCVPI